MEKYITGIKAAVAAVVDMMIERDGVLVAIPQAGAYSDMGIVPLHRRLCIDKYQPYC